MSTKKFTDSMGDWLLLGLEFTGHCEGPLVRFDASNLICTAAAREAARWILANTPGEADVPVAEDGSRAIDLLALSPHAINAHFAAHLMETTDGVMVGYDGRERECLAVRPVGVSAIKAVFDRDNYGNASELLAATNSVVPGLAAMQGLKVEGAYSETPF